MKNKTVTIFGVFDGLHDGHLEFIHQATERGEKLVVIIACDEAVKHLKGKIPINNELDRIKALLELEEVDIVLLGDREQDTYNILKGIKPDIVYLGYDQKDLHNSIKRKIKDRTLPKIKFIFGEPHKPKKFHSSILNK